MRSFRAVVGPCILGLSAAISCGASSSRDREVADEPMCADDGDCSGDTPKCLQSGACARSSACEVDDDCDGSSPFCHESFSACQACRVDNDCPTTTPVCVPHIEFGNVHCAQCRIGDSSTCPSETWCIPQLPIEVVGTGGVCALADCLNNPTGSPCISCQRENYAGCDGNGGECTSMLTALRSCYAAADPAWDESTCSVLTVPSSRDCSPRACAEEASLVDECLIGCEYVRSRCHA
jgi:hypothetical protein